VPRLPTVRDEGTKAAYLRLTPGTCVSLKTSASYTENVGRYGGCWWTCRQLIGGSIWCFLV
jgi:hypothetical protein